MEMISQILFSVYTVYLKQLKNFTANYPVVSEIITYLIKLPIDDRRQTTINRQTEMEGLLFGVLGVMKCRKNMKLYVLRQKCCGDRIWIKIAR